MLDQREAGVEDGRVRRPSGISKGVDVQGVDPDERRAGIDEVLGGRLGQERVV